MKGRYLLASIVLAATVLSMCGCDKSLEYEDLADNVQAEDSEYFADVENESFEATTTTTEATTETTTEETTTEATTSATYNTIPYGDSAEDPYAYWPGMNGGPIGFPDSVYEYDSELLSYGGHTLPPPELTTLLWDFNEIFAVANPIAVSMEIDDNGNSVFLLANCWSGVEIRTYDGYDGILELELYDDTTPEAEELNYNYCCFITPLGVTDELTVDEAAEMYSSMHPEYVFEAKALWRYAYGTEPSICTGEGSYRTRVSIVQKNGVVFLLISQCSTGLGCDEEGLGIYTEWIVSNDLEVNKDNATAYFVSNGS